MDGSSVRQIDVPPEARALSTLEQIDYEDAFLVEAPACARTAEEWARAILEDAPASVRRALVSGWSSIGLKLDRSGPSVLGWPIRVNTPDVVLLGADSRIGMPGQLLFKREQRGLLFATFVQHGNHAARALWAGVEPVHVPIVRRVLEQAAAA
jgi:hypothetical protein